MSVLYHHVFTEYCPVTVKGKEVGCLRKLETLECHFVGYSDHVEYLKSRGETRSLSTYHICVGVLHRKHYEYSRNKVIVLGNLSINRERFSGHVPEGHSTTDH